LKRVYIKAIWKLTGLYGLYPVFTFFDSSGKLCIPIREGNNLAAGNFASVWQSLQHYKTPEWFQNASLGCGLIGSRSANPNRKIGLGYL